MTQVDTSKLVTDLEPREAPVMARPGYLEPMIDPVFGTIVTRVTDPNQPVGIDDLNWNEKARHRYSSDQPWNADESVLALSRAVSGGYLFLDGQTYAPLFHRRMPGRVLWHPRLPETMVYISAAQVGLYQPATDRKDVLYDFSDEFTRFDWGSTKRNLTNDGRMLAAKGRRMSDGRHVAFSLDLESGERSVIDLDAIREEDATINVTISADGAVLRPYGRLEGYTDKRGQAQAGYKNGSELWFAPKYHEGHHGDHAQENGRPVYAGTWKGQSGDALHGHMVKRDMLTGELTSLLPYWGSHTGTRNIGRPEVAYVSYHTPSRGPLQKEVVGIYLDGSQRIERYCHTHRASDGYLSETHASPSPSGTRFIFASNWDRKATVAAYVVELPVIDPPVEPPVEGPTWTGQIESTDGRTIKLKGIEED